MESSTKKIKNLKSRENKFNSNNTFKTNKSATNLNFTLENNNKKNPMHHRYFSYGTFQLKKKNIYG